MAFLAVVVKVLTNRVVVKVGIDWRMPAKNRFRAPLQNLGELL
jgi:hypothetical protein